MRFCGVVICKASERAALFAVVEAAQAVDNLDEAAQYRSRALRHTGNAFHKLHIALFRLHTQASDEGGE